MVDHSDRSELVLQIVVGTAENIRAGRGETAVTGTEAGARLGISGARIGQLAKDGILRPVTFFQGTALFLESDVEALRLERARARGL